MKNIASMIKQGELVVRHKAILQNMQYLYVSLSGIEEALLMLSTTLNRAQPMFDRRVALLFAQSGALVIDGKSVKFRQPIRGRQHNYPTGWQFIALPEVDAAVPTRNFRVGRELPSDRLVTRVCDDIDAALALHKEMLEQIRFLSNFHAPQVGGAITKRVANMLGDAQALDERVKMDWVNNLDDCVEFVRAQNAERYQKRKQRKVDASDSAAASE